MTFSITVRFDSPYSEVASDTVPTLVRYCARHGYGLTILQNQPSRRDIIWDRMLPMISHESSSANWDVHMDADILITNPDITLESIVGQSGGASVIVGSGIYTGTMKMHVNDGILMVRRDIHGFRIAKAMWLASGNDVFCPMDGLRDIVASDSEHGRIFVAPPRMMNSYMMAEYGLPESTDGNWESGDFVLHLPGLPISRRVEIFSRLSA